MEGVERRVQWTTSAAALEGLGVRRGGGSVNPLWDRAVQVSAAALNCEL